MQKKDSVSLRNRVNATVRDIPRSGIRDFFDIVSTMKDVISLGIGETHHGSVRIKSQMGRGTTICITLPV